MPKSNRSPSEGADAGFEGKSHLKIKEIWAIRIRLQLEERIRDLAMFNLAIDSKLRACDLTALKVDDVAMSGRVRTRAIVIQKKTGRPVQFEITEQTRDTVARWIHAAGFVTAAFSFPAAFMRYPLSGLGGFAFQLGRLRRRLRQNRVFKVIGQHLQRIGNFFRPIVAIVNALDLRS
jgi:integrase